MYNAAGNVVYRRAVAALAATAGALALGAAATAEAIPSVVK
ncbi:hypothetical protein [Streptomyces sp. NPDC097981]